MKKILIGFLLIPVIIFAVGATFVLVGGGLNSLFKKDSGAPVTEKTASQAEKAETSAATAPVSAQVTKPSVSYATAYYDVSGSTKDEIRASKVQAKKGTFLQGHDAATTAETRINFKRRQLAGKCETVMDAFVVKLTYTYPRLITLSDVSSEVASEWSQFIVALTVHEEGHAKIETERASLLLKELQSLPSFATCEEFDQTWQARANVFDQETKQIEAAYDRETQDGKTQGVIF